MSRKADFVNQRHKLNTSMYKMSCLISIVITAMTTITHRDLFTNTTNIQPHWRQYIDIVSNICYYIEKVDNAFIYPPHPNSEFRILVWSRDQVTHQIRILV